MENVLCGENQIQRLIQRVYSLQLGGRGEGSGLMVWSCMSSQYAGNLHYIDEIMNQDIY